MFRISFIIKDKLASSRKPLDFHLRSAQTSVIAYMLLSYGISYYCLSNYSIVGGSHRQTYFHIAFCRYCKWANI